MLIPGFLGSVLSITTARELLYQRGGCSNVSNSAVVPPLCKCPKHTEGLGSVSLQQHLQHRHHGLQP